MYLRMLSRAVTGAALVVAALTSAVANDTPTMIGVNLSGGDFGTNNMPGTLGTHYFYPSAGHWDWAKGQGLELVRVPFRWERIQRETEGLLDAALWAPDLAAMDASLDLAEARGMRVILDMHNYGGRSFMIGGNKVTYKIGSPQLPTADYANAWRMIAAHFKDRTCLWGYDIMNEPHGLTGGVNAWVPMAQAAVNAIREVDTKTAIILEGYFYAQAQSWNTNGAPLINVVDPANNLIYSAHMYPDRGSDGLWDNGGTVQAEIVNNGEFPSVEAALMVGRNRIKPFVDWCVANNVRGLVGEYGSTRITDTANWAKVLENTLDYMRDHGNGLISGTQWGGGAWNSTYSIGMGARRDHSNAPFMPMVRNYVSGVGTNFWYGFNLYDESVTTTADYTFSYVFPNTTPATITFDLNDETTPAYSGSKSAALIYAVPSGTNAGAGIHIRGPLSVGAVGGVDISMSLAAGHVLSFFAKGTPGANPRITLGSTLNASGVDGGSDTATGNWISLGSVKPLTTEWQRYEIPLSTIVNAQLTGATRVQRLRFDALPANGSTYQVNFDRITIGTPSTNTPPVVSVDTATGGSTYVVGQGVGLVATAIDNNPGDSIDYVEFYVNHRKVGLDDAAPYEWTTTFSQPGSYAITAIAIDSHGITKQSAVKQVTVTAGAPQQASFHSTTGLDGWVRESTATSSVGGAIAAGKIRIGDDSSNRQYVGILSFDTSALPDNAVITSATLTVMRDTMYGTSPFTTHGACQVSIKTGAFNDNPALEVADFQAPATASNVATLSHPTANGQTASAALSAGGLAAINTTGVTQFRLAFTSGDDGDGAADYLQCNAGNDGNANKRPVLVITYH